MNLPSQQQIAAFSGHVITYAMGIVTALAATHVATADQAQNASNAITQISGGVASVIEGVATLISFGSAIWATVSASIRSQIASVQSHPDAQVNVTDPKLAVGIPGVQVVSKMTLKGN